MPLILVYGSLRANSKKGYNFRKEEQKYIRTLKLNGFKMHSFGWYPAIAPGDGEIVAELHEATERGFAAINQMELGAGYKPEVMTLEEGPATIYVWGAGSLALEKFPTVKDGDWQ